MLACISWRQLHWAEYTAEFLGTALFVFVGLSAVVLNFGAGLPMEHWLPGRSFRLLLTGLRFAGIGFLIDVSPLGKLSGTQINPDLSLAFWALGKMDHLDFIGSVLGQCSGALFGASLISTVWRNCSASVGNGMMLPGKGYSLTIVFEAEVTMIFVFVFAIFMFVSRDQLMKSPLLMTWLLVATMFGEESFEHEYFY